VAAAKVMLELKDTQDSLRQCGNRDGSYELRSIWEEDGKGVGEWSLGKCKGSDARSWRKDWRISVNPSVDLNNG
jgi:hypothetical protein